MAAYNMEAYFFKASEGEKVSLQDKHYNFMYCNHIRVNPTTFAVCLCLETGHRSSTHSMGGKHTRHEYQEIGILGTTKKFVSHMKFLC